MIAMDLFIFLSSRKEISLIINQEFADVVQLQDFPILTGTYGDIIITVVATSIINAFENNVVSYPINQLSIIFNIASNIKNINRQAASKLCQLFNIFTEFSFLLQSNYHPLCIDKLIKIIDLILAFHQAENENLIVELYKKREIIGRIY